MQQSQCLGGDQRPEPANPGEVAARPIKAANETLLDRVAAGQKNDWDSRGRRLCGQDSSAASCRVNNCHFAGHQIACQHWQPSVLVIGEPVFDRDVAPFDVTRFGQTSAECLREVRPVVACERAQEPDHRHRRLLRARCERPKNRRRHRRAADKPDDLAPFPLTEMHPLPRNERVPA